MKRLYVLLSVLGAVLLLGCEGTRSGTKADTAPFGGPDSVSYAGKLWNRMADEGLVGDDAILSTPYKGTHPHGAILDTIESRLTVRSHEGDVIVKRNYGGKGVSKRAVADDPKKWLKAVTVMYRREKGYDPVNYDWFWVKYGPDGSVLTNPKGMKLAGRVAKGAKKGCIACHSRAPGKDMVYNHNRYAK